MRYLEFVLVVIMISCAVYTCTCFPHTIVDPMYNMGSYWRYKGLCTFNLAAGESSWTLNVTFDKQVHYVTFYQADPITPASATSWMCTKNRYYLNPPTTEYIEFQVDFYGGTYPQGECLVVKNNNTHCASLDTTIPTKAVQTTTTTIQTTHVAITTTEMQTTAMSQVYMYTKHRPPFEIKNGRYCLCCQTVVCTLINGSTELETKLHTLVTDLLMDKHTLSSTRRKLTSAPDYRPSSQGIGCFGLLFVLCVLASIVLSDVLNYVKYYNDRSSDTSESKTNHQVRRRSQVFPVPQNIYV